MLPWDQEGGEGKHNADIFSMDQQDSFNSPCRRSGSTQCPSSSLFSDGTRSSWEAFDSLDVHVELSVGSRGHAAGTCTPCKFFRAKRGCRDGTKCTLCHHRHEELTYSGIRKAMKQSAIQRDMEKAAAMGFGAIAPVGKGAHRLSYHLLHQQRMAGNEWQRSTGYGGGFPRRQPSTTSFAASASSSTSRGLQTVSFLPPSRPNLTGAHTKCKLETFDDSDLWTNEVFLDLDDSEGEASGVRNVAVSLPSDLALRWN